MMPCPGCPEMKPQEFVRMPKPTQEQIDYIKDMIDQAKSKPDPGTIIGN